MMRKLYKQYHHDQSPIAKRVLLTMSEMPRVSGELLFSQMLKHALSRKVDGQGQGVIIIPGFMGRDRLNKPLVNFLNARGFKASGWMDGRNTGAKPDTIDKLIREVDFRYKATGQKVSLVGHSLGGIYAREISKKIPEMVERVISLGSPFSRDDQDRTVVNQFYRAVNKKDRVERTNQQLGTAPEVPTSSVFTRGDGIIGWRSAIQSNGHNKTENIEVYGSHCGLTNNAAVWLLLLDRLQQDSLNWENFSNDGWRKNIFPIAQLANVQANY